MQKFWIFLIIWGIFMILFPKIMWEMQKFNKKYEGEAPVIFIWSTRFIGIILIVASIIGIVYY